MAARAPAAAQAQQAEPMGRRGACGAMSTESTSKILTPGVIVTMAILFLAIVGVFHLGREGDVQDGVLTPAAAAEAAAE